MRGNKFGFKIFVLIAILCVGIASNFLYIGRALEPANAEDNGIYKTNYCSQKYDDNIIFSAEQVYYVQGESETNLRDNG